MESSSGRINQSNTSTHMGKDNAPFNISETRITIESLLDFIRTMEAFENLLLRHVKKLEDRIDDELREKATLMAENERLQSELDQLKEHSSNVKTKDIPNVDSSKECSSPTPSSRKESKLSDIELDNLTGVEKVIHPSEIFAHDAGNTVNTSETDSECSTDGEDDMNLYDHYNIISDDDLSEDDSVITTEYSSDSDSWNDDIDDDDEDDDDDDDDDDQEESHLCCYIPEQLKSPQRSSSPLVRSVSYQKAGTATTSTTVVGKTPKRQLPSIPNLTPLTMPLPSGFALQSSQEPVSLSHVVMVPPSRPAAAVTKHHHHVSCEPKKTRKMYSTTQKTTYSKELLMERRLQVESGHISPSRQPKATVNHVLFGHE
eukprot:scaffold9477_cov197-Amphora_coffeaeformis.AAC.8